MFVFGNFLLAVAKILDVVLTIYMWIIIARVIISWVSPNPYNPIVQFLHRATEPVLWRIRRYIPSTGFIDLSPIAVLLGIYFIRIFVVKTLVQIAYRWG